MDTTQFHSLEIPGKVFFAEGNNDLPKIVINTAWSTAEIYLHGAHISHFQKKNEPPVLWMSQFSRFEANAPIRGGIPVIFPWFGQREGEVMHGFARLQEWDLREISPLADGRVSLRLSLPDCASAALLPKFSADLVVTVGETLVVELIVTNKSDTEDFTFENCLHTYFTVGDINAVSVTGVKGAAYLDQCENRTRKTEHAEHIKILQETDRIYLDTASPIEIHDSKLQRRIRIEKSGSQSTVLWNPWVAKAQRMPDFGNEEYLQMICVESGNVVDNSITLPEGKSATLRVELSTLPL